VFLLFKPGQFLFAFSSQTVELLFRVPNRRGHIRTLLSRLLVLL
jgi:hypothetical protein